MVDKLTKKTNTDSLSNTPSSTVCCGIDHFFSTILKRPTEDLTEADRYAWLSCSIHLLNDVIFICFTDKNLFTLTSSHLITDCTHQLQQRRKTLEQKAFIAMAFSQSLSVCQNWITLFWLLSSQNQWNLLLWLQLACFCHNRCCLLYVRSPASSETRCTDHASFLTLIYCKVM